MNLEGNQRGGARDLARHLVKDENDHVEIYELRGFASDNLTGALNEIYAVSRGTACRKFLYSLSANPPPGENIETPDYIAAIERVERKLGLSDQPRAIVFHEKEGRRHAHAVWSRIDTEAMKAIHIGHDHLKLKDVSRELFLEHGWKMPKGYARSSERDPKNFTLKEWQAAKRRGKDPRTNKTAIQDAWAVSDSKAAFENALAERGLKVARGDRAGIVALDIHGDVQSVARVLPKEVRLRHVRERVGHEKDLPSVDEAKAALAKEIGGSLSRIQDELKAREQASTVRATARKDALITAQRAERSSLLEKLRQQQQTEALMRQARFRKGLGGIWDRLRGVHKRTQLKNEQEADEAARRDQQEKDRLIIDQLTQRRLLKQRMRFLKQEYAQRKQDIEADQSHLNAMRDYAKEARQKELGRIQMKKSGRSSRRGPEPER